MRKNSPYLLRSVRDAELTISAPDGTKAKGSSPSNQRASAEPHQEGCRIAGKRANDPRNAGDDREYPPPGGGHSVAILLRRSSALRITDDEKTDRDRCANNGSQDRKRHGPVGPAAPEGASDC